jgi:hypothetical protein
MSYVPSYYQPRIIKIFFSCQLISSTPLAWLARKERKRLFKNGKIVQFMNKLVLIICILSHIMMVLYIVNRWTLHQVDAYNQYFRLFVHPHYRWLKSSTPFQKARIMIKMKLANASRSSFSSSAMLTWAHSSFVLTQSPEKTVPKG